MQLMWKGILKNDPFARAGIVIHFPALVISKKHVRNQCWKRDQVLN